MKFSGRQAGVVVRQEEVGGRFERGRRIVGRLERNSAGGSG